MTMTDLRQLVPIVEGLSEVVETLIARVETLEAEVDGLHEVAGTQQELFADSSANETPAASIKAQPLSTGQQANAGAKKGS